MTEEALQIALEALTDFDYDKRMSAIEVIKETLETKEWVGLTEEEFKKLINDAGFTRSDLLMMGACVEEIVYLVEAKLKEKNT